MDQRERADPFEAAVLLAIEGKQAGLWTALPGEIVSFDPIKNTCVVQPTIQIQRRSPDGSTSLETMPLLLDCPVMFPSGGGITLTFPLMKGDECLAVFSSRCIDAVWQSSGVQPQAELRMHDLSDGFAFVGWRSQPRVLSAISTTAAQLRSDDGSTVVEMNPTAKTVGITAPNGATVTANLTITGNLHVTGTITGDTDVVGGGKSLKTHTHQVTAVGSPTSAPL